MAVARETKQTKKRMKEKMTKERWVALFDELGLNEKAMRRWHQLFESRHPEAHQGFLEWLGIGAVEIGRIRGASR
jgi:hypothetical protein